VGYVDDVWIRKISSDCWAKPLVLAFLRQYKFSCRRKRGPAGGNPGDAGRIGKPVLLAGFRPRWPVDQRQRPSNRQVGAVRPGEAPPSHAWRGLAFICARVCPLRSWASLPGRSPGAAADNSVEGSSSGSAHGARRSSLPRGQRDGRTAWAADRVTSGIRDSRPRRADNARGQEADVTMAVEPGHLHTAVGPGPRAGAGSPDWRQALPADVEPGHLQTAAGATRGQA
jgi:hypothetical protein